jgi:hypothetical protein
MECQHHAQQERAQDLLLPALQEQLRLAKHSEDPSQCLNLGWHSEALLVQVRRPEALRQIFPSPERVSQQQDSAQQQLEMARLANASLKSCIACLSKETAQENRKLTFSRCIARFPLLRRRGILSKTNMNHTKP